MQKEIIPFECIDIYNFILSVFVNQPPPPWFCLSIVQLQYVWVWSTFTACLIALWWSWYIIVQLQQVRVEAADASKRLKELQSELVATKERCSQQAEDLNRKSGMV